MVLLYVVAIGVVEVVACNICNSGSISSRSSGSSNRSKVGHKLILSQILWTLLLEIN